jgi:hypothetical protein
MSNNSEMQVKPDNSSEENLAEKNINPINLETANDSFVVKIKKFISHWKFKLSVVLISLVGILFIIFFWQHIIAVQGLRGWAKHAQAEVIDCMTQDTNGDQYISCTAKIDTQIVPLECGTSLLNMGCRVNYGNASPTIKLPENLLPNP